MTNRQLHAQVVLSPGEDCRCRSDTELVGSAGIQQSRLTCKSRRLAPNRHSASEKSLLALNERDVMRRHVSDAMQGISLDVRMSLLNACVDNRLFVSRFISEVNDQVKLGIECI